MGFFFPDDKISLRDGSSDNKSRRGKNDFEKSGAMTLDAHMIVWSVNMLFAQRIYLGRT